MTTSPSARPTLTSDLMGAGLLRRYWLKDEVTAFARSCGIRARSDKELVLQRLASHLDGGSFTEPVTAQRRNVSQLSGPLTPGTLIPAGQRCSQVLRAWFAEELGPAFRFDGEMRDYFAAADGTQTLADALAHWHRSRSPERKSIDAQFEYNRFTRAWHGQFPAGSKAELLSAWHEYRGQPVDARVRA